MQAAGARCERVQRHAQRAAARGARSSAWHQARQGLRSCGAAACSTAADAQSPHAGGQKQGHAPASGMNLTRPDTTVRGAPSPTSTSSTYRLHGA